MLWDAANLYLYAHVTDADVRVIGTGHDGELWNADGIELLLDPAKERTVAPDATDRHLIVTAQGDVRDAAGAGSTENTSFDITGLGVRATRDATGYQIAVSIPWGPLGATPQVGLVMGGDLALNDLEATGLTSADWAQINPFAQPTRWNEIQLVDSMGNGGTGGNPGTGATMDGGCQCQSLPAAPHGGALLCILLVTTWGCRPRGSRSKTPRKTL
jgi:hypothetical protein